MEEKNENNINETLTWVIEHTCKDENLKSCYKDGITNFCAEALANLVKNGESNKFPFIIRGTIDEAIENSANGKEQVMDFFINDYFSYLKSSNEIDSFENTLKNTLENLGEDKTKDLLKKFLVTGEREELVVPENTNISGYEPDAMYIVMARHIVDFELDKGLEYSNIKTTSNKQNGFGFSDLAAVAQKTHDIDSIISTMEICKSGKIPENNEVQL